MSSKKRKSTDSLVGLGASPAVNSSAVVDFLCSDNISSNLLCQDSQFSEHKEFINSFIPKKLDSNILANSYYRLSINDLYYYNNKAKRVFECGSFLSFAHEIDLDGVISEKGKLHFANFCKDRLCPMCSWRRSYKIFSQVSQIMNVIHSEYKFLFLTLTIPNVKADELSNAINNLMSAWNRFSGYKDIKKIMRGYFRALEITYNKKLDSFHPHFHIVFAVPLSYFKDKYYLKRDDFLSLWQNATRDNSITQVDIRVCKNKYSDDEIKSQQFLSSAVAEVAKYAVKSSDYLFKDNDVLTDYLVKTFSEALKGRRLVQFGGVFKDVFKSLNLDDAESENADLIHFDNELNPALSWLICRYGWSSGIYKLIDTKIETSDKH